MKKLAIYGYGGHAREVAAIIDDDIIFFIDDEYSLFENTFYISAFNPHTHKIMVAVADPHHRKRMAESLPVNTEFFSYVHPTAIVCNAEIGDGSYIGPYSIVTTNVKIGKHAILNRGNQIGHDFFCGDYLSMMPMAVIGGNVEVGDCVYFGSCSNVREKIKIKSNVKIGLNAGVTNHIEEPGVYVGTPAKKIK